MKIRVTKTATIDPETLKTIAKDTLYHLYIDKEDGNGESEVCASHDTDTMRNYIKMVKAMNGGN